MPYDDEDAYACDGKPYVPNVVRWRRRCAAVFAEDIRYPSGYYLAVSGVNHIDMEIVVTIDIFYPIHW